MLTHVSAISGLGNRVYRATASGVMLAAMVALGVPVAAAPVFFEVGGSAATSSIEGTVDAFRAALGDPQPECAGSPRQRPS